MPKAKQPPENRRRGRMPKPGREATEEPTVRTDQRVEERAAISPEEAMAEFAKLFEDGTPPSESGKVR